MNPILTGAPWLIAHRSMLGINQPYKLTLNGYDYVLWQNSQGEICALDNICPHMQAPLSNGWICKSRNSIACRYHALEFDGKGRQLKDGEAKGEPLSLFCHFPRFTNILRRKTKHLKNIGQVY